MSFVAFDIGCGVFVGGIDDEDKRASAAMSSSTLLLPSKAISKPKLSQGSRDYTLKHVKKQQSLSHSPKTKTSGFTVASGQGSPSDSPGTNRWFKPEIDAPSPIRSIQIEEKAMKDLRRFYSSVKTRGSSTKPLSSYLLLLAVGVTNFAVNGTSEKDWDLVKEMGETYPSVVPCIGLHPCDTDEIGAETENFLVDAIESSDSPLLGNETAGDEKYFGKRRKIASWSIARVCIGVLGLASAASAERLPMLFIILTTGAITALCVSLLGSLLAQPTNSSTSEKHNSCWCACTRIFHGFCTVVRDACVLVLRYVPPDGVPLSSHWSLLESVMVLPNSYNDHGAALGEKEPLGGHMR
ncbi:unnamed protein product [Arabidopsis arenosa]|uniref:Uncharacterized protein n=1 Tax=Arabidopsis arenosa TaxID=38785 RepID=A0A8S2A124_ARAAE|nr:unnamed protein product [Arabidopsis arenosa]